MPTPADILAGLTRIATGWSALAIAWHAGIGALLIALLAGWRPSRALLGALMTLPLLSVSALAWLDGNPFNATVFVTAAIAVLTMSAAMPGVRISLSTPGYLVAGLAMIGFGWIYPHFLEDGPAWRYIYAAPTGLVPCPTVSAVIGFTLLTRGLGSRAVSLLLAALGLFYGVFGALHLGVHLDIGLAVGAAALAILAFRSQPRGRAGAAGAAKA